MVSVLAVSGGVVVISVAAAVVLVVLLVTMSLRGQGKRGAVRRHEARHDLEDAQERAVRAEHERDDAREGGPDH